MFTGMKNYTIRLPETLASELVKQIAEIDEFKGRWEALRNIAPDRLVLLRKIATIASIGSSTRIEGSRLSDAQVDELLSMIDGKSFRSRDEEEVAGYADAMNIVFNSFQDIPITENHIKQLHGILLKYSSKDSRHKGEYKKFPNNVEAFDSEGNSVGIIFKTTDPFATPYAMQDLVQWYSAELTAGNYHPLLIIAAFAVHFLAIHPFQDGNGRLSRILTTLMLLKAGYLYVPYCSIESIVEENKDQYYRSLRKAQSSFSGNHSGMKEWLKYFLLILKKQKEILEQRIEQESSLSITTLSPVSAAIIKLIGEHSKLTISDIVIFSGINRNTVKKHLKELVEKRFINKNGVGKGTWYSRL
ncbi:MAG: Fic family protein [Chitinispirillaceae bacterium]|nr:Fic family protein [Chitinispirillaceae bacterium]